MYGSNVFNFFENYTLTCSPSPHPSLLSHLPPARSSKPVWGADHAPFAHTEQTEWFRVQISRQNPGGLPSYIQFCPQKSLTEEGDAWFLGRNERDQEWCPEKPLLMEIGRVETVSPLNWVHGRNSHSLMGNRPLGWWPVEEGGKWTPPSEAMRTTALRSQTMANRSPVAWRVSLLDLGLARPGHPEELEVPEGKQIVWASFPSGQVSMSFFMLPGLPSGPGNSQQGLSLWRISSTTSHYCSLSFRFRKGCTSTLIREEEAKITNLCPFMYQVLGRCLCIFYIL